VSGKPGQTQYLNFDMIGSPNHVFFIYDGDDSDGVGAPAGPAGSAAIEAAFKAYFDAFAVPTQGTDFSGWSDYGPFIAQGIPAGGLFTGAEGIKTAAQVALWGGTAGQQYDPCYHQACDTYANVNEYALGMNADALAQVVAGYAADTAAVNGVEGKGKKKSKDKSKIQFEYWGPHAIRCCLYREEGSLVASGDGRGGGRRPLSGGRSAASGHAGREAQGFAHLEQSVSAFVAGYRRNLGGTLQELEHVLRTRLASTLLEKLARGTDRTDFLGHGRSNELVQRHAVESGKLSGRVLHRRRQLQRVGTLAHRLSSWMTLAGVRTGMPNAFTAA
jgi:hypothetical protein